MEINNKIVMCLEAENRQEVLETVVLLSTLIMRSSIWSQKYATYTRGDAGNHHKIYLMH